MTGKCQPHDEGSEIRLDADQLKRLGTRSHRQAQTEEHEELTVTGTIEEPAVQRSGGDDCDDHRDRPERRGLIDGEREEQDGEYVLNDQDPDGDAPGERGRFVALLERLDGEDRAGKREGEANENGLAGRQVRGTRKPDGTENHEHRSDDGGRDHEMRRCRSPHNRPGERLQLELQADAEQQQQDAEVGDNVDGVG